MILIADSGSTKTAWALVDRSGTVFEYETAGINPFFQTTQEIYDNLNEKLMPFILQINVAAIYFYGAGCATDEKKEVVATPLRQLFPNAVIKIESDLLGAARASCQHTPGIVCILGTGSNSCFYDGDKIVKNVSPLGYILGDEGSGAALGKQLVADCLKNQMPQYLTDRFFKRFNLTPAVILDKVYKQPFPNRFLAGFTPFLKEEIAETPIAELVYKGFRSFLIRNIRQYDYENFDLNCIGSVAFHFEDLFRLAAEDQGMIIGGITKNPMNGLIKFHTNSM